MPRSSAILSLALVCAAGPLAAAPPTQSQAAATLQSLPAWFEPNTGQAPAPAGYFSRGGSGTLLVEPAGARFSAGMQTLDLRFRGALAQPSLEGDKPLPSYSSYLTGRDRSQWKARVPHFESVRARNLYRGIDAVYYLRDGHLEYDLVVAPGASPAQIRMAFAHAGKPKRNAAGDLVFANGLRQAAPISYQIGEDGKRQPVASRYLLRGEEVTFAVGDYDRSRELVIDPILYASYFGGDRDERANAIAVSPTGRVYIAGSSASTLGAIGNTIPLQEAPRANRDVFLAQLTPDPATGQLQLNYWTAYGGGGQDEATAIAVDARGFVYLVGSTTSNDLQLAGSSIQNAFGGNTDALIAVIRPEDGADGLWFAQYFGGTENDVATCLALGTDGAMYIGGYSNSPSLPTTANGFIGANRGAREGFLARVVTSASPALTYATFFGGNRTDSINAIALDADGTVFVAGYTVSDDFPVTSDAYLASPQSIFLAKFDLRRSGFDSQLYTTYIGGDALDVATSLVVDRGGNPWIAGYTFSDNLPASPNAYRSRPAGRADGFVMRFDWARRSQPDAVGYLTYFGGRFDDVPYSMILLRDGTLALTGYTFSDDFPRIDASAPVRPGRGADVFIAVIDPNRQGEDALRFSTTRGGALEDTGKAIAQGLNGLLYVSGSTLSSDLPVTNNTTKISPGGARQSFVMHASPSAN